MFFTGNQHNPDWAWSADYLKGLTDNELWELHLKYRRSPHSGEVK
jgi:hypothetical protein